MEKEKINDQPAEVTPAVAEPVAEAATAPKQRRKRRTKAEIEADAKKAAAKAKRAAKKAASTAKQAVEEGAQVAEKVTKPRIPTPEIVVQYSGSDIGASALTDAAVAQFKAVKKRTAIKDIKLYIKPEENAAYFVINGDFTGKVDF